MPHDVPVWQEPSAAACILNSGKCPKMSQNVPFFRFFLSSPAKFAARKGLARKKSGPRSLTWFPQAQTPRRDFFRTRIHTVHCIRTKYEYQEVIFDFF